MTTDRCFILNLTGLKATNDHQLGVGLVICESLQNILSSRQTGNESRTDSSFGCKVKLSSTLISQHFFVEQTDQVRTDMCWDTYKHAQSESMECSELSINGKPLYLKTWLKNRRNWTRKTLKSNDLEDQSWRLQSQKAKKMNIILLFETLKFKAWMELDKGFSCLINKNHNTVRSHAWITQLWCWEGRKSQSLIA